MSGSSDYHVHRHRDWTPQSDSFQFSDKPFQNPSGGLSIGFRYDAHKLRVKTPKMRVPFGLQTGMNGNGFNLQLSFDDSEDSQNFLANCEKFDEVVNQAGRDHASDWFAKAKNGKPVPVAVIDDKFSAMVKQPPAGKDYPPTFRVKLPSKEMIVDDPDNPEADKDGKLKIDAFQCRLFNREKEPLAIDDEVLRANCYVSVLMVCNSIWSTTSGFGASWKAEQIMVFPNESQDQLPDYCLPDMDSDDEDESAQHAPVMVGDDDNEEEKPTEEASEAEETPEEEPEAEEEPEPEAEEEPEPEPEPVRKPTVRARKPAVKK